MTAVDRPAVDPLAEAIRTCNLLWPGREVWVAESSARDEPVGREFMVVPAHGPPRFLLPSTSRRAAISVITRVNSSVGVSGRLRRCALAAAVETGAMARWSRRRLLIGPATDERAQPTIEDELLRITGERLSVTFGLGTERANRKPVLTALNASGRARYFVKLGHTPFTKKLVTGEADSLRTIEHHDHPSFVAPRCVHHGQWNSVDLLVMDALPSSLLRGWPRSTRPWEAMSDVAGLQPDRAAAATSQAYLERLSTRPDIPVEPARDTFLRALGELRDAAGHLSLRMGSWHGDWAPDNMLSLRGQLLVWDWERFETGVPWGFDGVHYCFQAARYAGGWDRARAALDTEVPAALRRLGVEDRHVALTTVLYLATIAERYLRDMSSSGVDSIGAVAESMLNLLEERARAV